MEYPFTVPGLDDRVLAIRSAGMLHGPRLVVNGVPAKGERGRFRVADAQGREFEIRVKPSALGIDPVPAVDIGGRTIQLARPFDWYEWAWFGWPVLLVVAGGALGAICGLMAAYAGARIFRTDIAPPLKYLLSAAISLGALVVYLLVAAGVQLLLK